MDKQIVEFVHVNKTVDQTTLNYAQAQLKYLNIFRHPKSQLNTVHLEPVNL